MNKVISSKENEKIKHLKKLQNKKYRQKFNEFLIEGDHLIDEALKNNFECQIYSTKPNEKHDFLITKEVLKHVSLLVNSEQKIAKVKIKETSNDFLNIDQKSNILFLNNLQDPTNIGTLLRSALSFNFKNIIYDNLDIYNPKIIRASQGAIFALNFFKSKNHQKTLKYLQEKNYEIIGTFLHSDSTNLYQNSFDKKIVLILGNEGLGIEKEILTLIDKNVIVPINFESLNVAIAGSIIMSYVENKGSKNEA
ncbi:TrmH family RNA methyltransferase [Mycoplasmopsis pulmonis]|uniref:TrmH family RNA methyltransferase n=1 Tax=Mycoplasmopsis pulmonis TaxID=2107 RepID=UPI0010052240|nr:RNA methyltransferase [Mycoplasmopsis pulmonis]VEU68067.1 tRNA/rRNA methyltransferase [Mycoplasmopsis pulmonis]